MVDPKDLEELPVKAEDAKAKEAEVALIQEASDLLIKRLHNVAHDPSAEGKASGVAFEEAIAETFSSMGFDAKRI